MPDSRANSAFAGGTAASPGIFAGRLAYDREAASVDDEPARERHAGKIARPDGCKVDAQRRELP